MSNSNSYVENEVEKFNHPIDIYNDSSQSNAKSLDTLKLIFIFKT